MAIPSIKKITDNFQSRFNQLVEKRVPPNERAKLDTTFRQYSGDLWKLEIVKPNGKKDYPERFNYLLATNPERVKKELGINVPWYPSKSELTDPKVASLVKAIDIGISRIRKYLAIKYPNLTVGSAEYDKKFAVALYVLLHATYLAKSEYEVLEKFGLKDFASQFLPPNERTKSGKPLFLPSSVLQTAPKLTGIGLRYDRGDFTDRAGTVFDALKFGLGDCTEYSYIYHFAATRAGLKAKFALASITEDGTPNHLHNIVELANGSFIKIDLAQHAINMKYPDSMQVDLYQTLAVFHGDSFAIARRAGASLEKLGNFASTAIAIDSRSPISLLFYGNYLSLLGKNKEAIEIYELGIRYGGNNQANLNYNLAISYQKRADEKDKERANNLFQKVYNRLLPAIPKYTKTEDQIQYYKVFADAAYYTGRLPTALKYFKKLVQLSPSNPDAYSNYAQALVANGRRHEAMKVYDLLMKMTIKDERKLRSSIITYLRTAEQMLKMNEMTTDEFIKVFEKAAQVEPKQHKMILYNLAAKLFNAQKFSDVAKVAPKCLAANPNNVALNRLYAKTELLLGTEAYNRNDAAAVLKHLTKAKQLYETTIKLNPKTEHKGAIYYNYGLTLQGLAELEKDKTKAGKLAREAKSAFKNACNSNQKFCP